MKIISSMDSEARSSKPAARRRGATSGSIFLYRLDSYISLLIIPCIIYYATNKETLTLTLRRIMSLMRLYSLTASDLEDWACSGEEPGTHLPNELTQAGTDSKLICILTKAQSGLRMVSSGTACPQLLRQMIPAGHSSKQPPTRDRCCFFQEVHNELTKVWHASTLLILPPSPLLMALKKKGYGKLSI